MHIIHTRQQFQNHRTAGTEQCIGDTVRGGMGRQDMGMDMGITISMGRDDMDGTAPKQLCEAVNYDDGCTAGE